MPLFKKVVKMLPLTLSQFLADLLARILPDILNRFAHFILFVGNNFLDVSPLSQCQLQITFQPVHKLFAQNLRQTRFDRVSSFGWVVGTDGR